MARYDELDEHERNEEQAVAEALAEVLLLGEAGEELQRALQEAGVSGAEGPVRTASFKQVGLLTGNEGFELRIGARRFQITVVEA